MTINSHLSSFYGLKIEEYKPEKSLQNSSNTAYKIAVSWDDSENGVDIEQMAKSLLEDPGALDLRALVIGNWEESYENSPQQLIDLLVANAGKLPNLKAIFFGDIVMEESEISWIVQGNYQAFFKAFPDLEHFQVRGSNGLELGLAKQLHLKTLIVECGGLPTSIIQNIAKAELPELTHLELWLGSDNYGYDAEREDIENLINTPFPKLNYLGLRDSEQADLVAEIIAKAPILKQISSLDLSLGNISDKGAKALIESPFIALLEKLDLHHHYISDSMQAKIKELGINVDLSDEQEEDGDDDEVYRYIAVSE